jgi:lipopolysaccharide/colanic/teichoic acid biosynthesis glycosyltransferase
MATRAVNDIGTRGEPGRRAVDVSVSAVLLLVVLPVILLTAIASAIVLRAWPFFAQERIGRDGTTFRFIKVRTLPPDMPAYTDKHQLDVQRIPALCRLLRRLHLDELPQLFLVLRGHMSLIGPRPEMAYLHEQFPPAFAALRTSIRPAAPGCGRSASPATASSGPRRSTTASTSTTGRGASTCGSPTAPSSR